jgi:RNA polymerase sigma factor (TIGR02999 family)
MNARAPDQRNCRLNTNIFALSSFTMRRYPGMPLPSVMTQTDNPITELLDRWRQGDRSAESALIEAIYPLLRKLAASQIQQRDDSLTLSATDLAHEAYLRLQEQHRVEWKNRDHFFAIAATVVRRVVIDYLRERFADKRAGGKMFVDVEDCDDEALREEGAVIDWIAVDRALNKLQTLDPDCARVVELKLFTPLDAEQIAACCRSSLATVGRHWRFGRIWLARELDVASIQDAS